MKKEDLIEKCTAVLTSYGAKVSADEIARKLGISKRTLYEMIESKENLIFECINYTIARMKTIIDSYFANNENNVIEKLFPISNPNLQMMLLEDNRFVKDVQRLYPDIYRQTMEKHVESYRKTVISILREGMENGTFLPETNPELIVDVTFMIHRSLSDKLEFFEKFSPVELFRNTAYCFVRGISTPMGINLIEKQFKTNFIK